MIPYIASNIGFGLPPSLFFRVELISKEGPAIRLKIGAESESSAAEFAKSRANGWLLKRRGLERMRVRECGQFEAVFTSTRKELDS